MSNSRSRTKIASGTEAQILMQDMINSYLEEAPKKVKGVTNQSTMYYVRKLYRLIKPIINFDNTPETWDISYLKKYVYRNGFLGVCDTELGVLPLTCGYSGINVFEKPTKLVYANPVLGSFEREIDKDCVMLYINDDFIGINDLVVRYATLLAMCDSAISVNLMNSKVANIFTARNKQQADTIKKMYDKISAGEPMVVVRDDDFDTKEPPLFTTRVKDTFVGNEIEELQRMIYKQFLLDIGVNAINEHKRERQTSTEVSSSIGECYSSVYDWFQNLSIGIEKVNKMFDLNISVSLNPLVIANIDVGVEDGKLEQSDSI